MSGKLYLLTGATGHLGMAILKCLAARGCDVRALVLPGDDTPLPVGVRRCEGNVLDPASMEAFFSPEGYERLVLLHCAAAITIASRNDPNVWAVNVTGTRNVLALARRAGVARIVHVSSVHAIPERPRPEIITEADRFSPDWVHGQYAKSKAAATELALEAARSGLNLSVVHPSGLIGPGDVRNANNSMRVLRAVASGKLRACVRGGYDFVDVRDVAEGVLQCEAHGRAGECYILSGQYISMKELFGRVCELAGRKPPRVEVPTVVARLAAPLAEWAAALRGKKPLFTPYAAYTLQSNSNFSHDKASAAFGYHPGPLDDALRDMLCEETGSK